MESETNFTPKEETAPEAEKVEKVKKWAIKYAAREMLEGAR